MTVLSVLELGELVFPAASATTPAAKDGCSVNNPVPGTEIADIVKVVEFPEFVILHVTPGAPV